MRLLISGGHLTPALALIDYIQKTDPNAKIVFVGRVFSRHGDLQPSPEKYEVSKREIKFVAFDSGKFDDGNIFTKALQFLKTIKSTLVALIIIAKYQPTVFVSFGGYLALPLAIASWLWRVPIITHEQTKVLGIANKLIAPFAKTVALSFEDTTHKLSHKKIVVTGNPVRQSLFEPTNKPPWLKGQLSKPILYITGGSQGSEIINSTVMRMLDQLLKDWLVIHQCGYASKTRDYQSELNRVKEKISKAKQNRYFIRPWVDELDLAWIYDHAYATITRAGANTLMEITLKALPSIIIPLPFSNNDEQLLNAKALSEKQASILLLQKELSPESLSNALAELNFKYSSLKKNLSKIALSHQQAVQNLYAEIKKISK